MTTPIDPRAWLLWAIAASLPPLVGRNPAALLATLFAVLGVWAVWRAEDRAGWDRVLRLGAMLTAVGVLFNVLTVHSGDLVFARLPASWPLIGGPLTINALVYGVLSGIAVLALLLVGVTLGAVLDWATVLRLLPDRLTTVAVVGSVAWALIPQTTRALREIREAQSARGYRPRGVRDVAPLLVPLLAGSLERSLMLAEALESRAFGAPARPEAAYSATGALWTVAGLTLGVLAAYALALGQAALGSAALVLAALALWAGLRDPRHDRDDAARRTRYREPVWDRRATVIAGTAGAALAAQIATLATNPAAFAFDPYPTLMLPAIGLPLLVALGLLLAPAMVR